MAQMEHVHAYLVGSARVQRAQNQGGVRGRVCAEQIVVRNGGFPGTGIDYCHFQAIDGMAADMGEDRAGTLGRNTLDDGQITLFRASGRELRRQGLVGAVTVCDDQAAPQWWSRAFTMVPSGLPAAGCTTMPLSLLMTTTSSSSYRMSRGIS